MPNVNPGVPLPNSTLQASDIKTDGSGNKYFDAGGYINPPTNTTSGSATVSVGSNTWNGTGFTAGTPQYAFHMPYDSSQMDNETLTLDLDFDLQGGGTASTSYQIQGVQTPAAAKKRP